MSILDRIPVLGRARARAQAQTDVAERIAELELGVAENAALATGLASYVDGLEREVMSVIESRLGTD